MGAIESFAHVPLIEGPKTLQQVSGEIGAAAERKPTWMWWAAFLISSLLLVTGAVAVVYEFRTGVGTWGVNNTVGWAFAITNFVFWKGIRHPKLQKRGVGHNLLSILIRYSAGDDTYIFVLKFSFLERSFIGESFEFLEPLFNDDVPLSSMSGNHNEFLKVSDEAFRFFDILFFAEFHQ